MSSMSHSDNQTRSYRISTLASKYLTIISVSSHLICAAQAWNVRAIYHVRSVTIVTKCSRAMSASRQAESVIRNIIKEICQECSTLGQNVSETLAAFMVCVPMRCKCVEYNMILSRLTAFSWGQGQGCGATPG